MSPATLLAPGTALPIARYRFEARMQAPLRLPDYAGSLLRGSFGAALRRSACMTGLPQCSACPLYRSCPYPALFETPPRDTTLRQKFSQLPNPYVIEPPAIGARNLQAGDALVFHMVLVGADALRQLPLIVHAWQRALRHGLGKTRAPAQLEALCWVGPDAEQEPVFNPDTGQVQPHDVQLLLPELPPAMVNGLSLNVATPLRLQHQSTPLGPAQLDVRTLALAVLRRASLMLQIHAAMPLLPDVPALLGADGEQWQDDRSRLRWHDWVRYSSRQQQEMTLGGVVGQWQIKGPMQNLWPWFWLGQWLHLGKNATMGMGQYHLCAAD